MTRTFGATRNCGGCRYWSEMIAQANPNVEALCLSASSPERGRYKRGGASCAAWASGEHGAIDDPHSDAQALYDAEAAAPARDPAGEFNVVQFFSDDTHEYVRRRIDAESAVHAAKQYSESVGAQIGTTVRVIITDGGDFTVFEWKRGQGVVFLPREEAQS